MPSNRDKIFQEIDSISDRIAFLIKAHGLKQKEIACLSGLSQNYVSQVVRKRRSPNLELVISIALNLPDVSLDWLLTGQGDAHKSDDKEKARDLENGLADFHQSSISQLLECESLYRQFHDAVTKKIEEVVDQRKKEILGDKERLIADVVQELLNNKKPIDS